MNALVWMMGWVLALSASVSVQATETSAADSLAVRDGWIRPAPPTAPVRAGYVVLENRSGSEIAIDAVRSEAFGAIEIHEMHDVDGVMRMRRVPRLVVEADASVELKPGGLHLMLFRPATVLESGTVATLVFSSDGADVARGDFIVREPE